MSIPKPESAPALREVTLVASPSRRTHALRVMSDGVAVGVDEGGLRTDGSQRQARLFLADGGALFVEALDGASLALNGSGVSAPVKLNDGDWLLFGSHPFQARVLGQESVAAEAPAPAQGAAPARDGAFLIGRLPQCDVVIPSPLVSKQHARLTRLPDGWVLEDCQSTNGTFLNGRRIAGKAQALPGDRLSFAAFEFVFTGERLEAATPGGRVRIEARHVTKEVKDTGTGQPRRLLDDINLVVEPGEFVVLFGTSGSGKSTLLDTLNGRRPATGGSVLYNDTDLYLAFDSFRSAIGYVPQQDIVHRKITVERALKYTGLLRLPPDTSSQEMDCHVGRVLEKVGLAEKAALAIDTPAPLSGGQLKRVSLAVELVANPNVLFLDEVTSGLDAGTDKRMMQLFANLAKDGKTVVCVTHTLENIDACHLVVLLHQGKLVFYGPPQAVCGYFGIGRLSEVYELLESRPAAEWADKFRVSSFHETYIARRMHTPITQPVARQAAAPDAPPASRWFDVRQAVTLMRRYLDLMAADRRNLLILILQAPLIALVIGLVFDIEQELPLRVAKESQISFILVLSAIWFGCLNSARELVKELPVYLRERSVNLGLAPYLVSKLIPLAALCLLQCALLLGVVSAMIAIPGDFLARFAVLFGSGMAATAMGLAVSAFVNSNDKAVATVPILLIPQVILSGAVVKLKGGGLWFAKGSMISYWAFDAMKASLSQEVRSAKDFLGNSLLPLDGSVANDLGIIVAMGCVFLAAAVLGLKMKDRVR
ncbi:MAG TPA: ATP-binding cassette domain-containing protein [Methylococcaceae bacterium]|nr:ATP-binding cassette domain-containing protein [Methylococcaceae bacterium]